MRAQTRPAQGRGPRGVRPVQPVLSLVVHEFRARWRGWAVLVLLVAVAGGAVLAAAAGARRTSSAYPRYLHASHASDLLVSVAGTGLTGFYGALARQPGVALLARGIGLNVQPLTGPGGWTGRPPPRLRRVGAGDELDAPRVLAGRLPRLDRAARSRWTRSPRLPCIFASAAHSAWRHWGTPGCPGRVPDRGRLSRRAGCASGWWASWSRGRRLIPSPTPTRWPSSRPARRWPISSAPGTGLSTGPS